jgi:hypothetical protein
MTTDNASGAGMERIRQALEGCEATQGADKPYEVYAEFRGELAKACHQEAMRSLLDAHDDATRLLAESQAHNAKLEAQVERLRQGLWDVYAALGCDTDGDPTPVALVSDIVELVVNAAKEARRDYDAALKP